MNARLKQCLLVWARVPTPISLSLSLSLSRFVPVKFKNTSHDKRPPATCSRERETNFLWNFARSTGNFSRIRFDRSKAAYCSLARTNRLLRLSKGRERERERSRVIASRILSYVIRSSVPRTDGEVRKAI